MAGIVLPRPPRPGSLPGRLLDLAFPASVCRLPPRGDAAVRRSAGGPSRPGAGTPAGMPLGMPSDVPLPLVQLEWCCPYGDVSRDCAACPEVRRRAPPGATPRRGGRRPLAGGRRSAATCWSTSRSTPPVAPTRGYDQAELLARAAADALGLPAVPALRRERATAPQFELGRDRRAANVAAAFAVTPAGAAAVRGRWPVLVDDVVTTGATLVACAAALLDAGAVAVSALTVAREA